MVFFDLQMLILLIILVVSIASALWLTGGNDLSIGVLMGICMIVSGLLKLITGTPGLFKGLFPVPVWTAWLFIPVGIIVTVMSLRAIRRGEGKPKSPTDEDVARAKADLERIYLRDHGELPKPPEDGK